MAMVSRVGALGLDDAAQRPDGSGDVVGCDVRAGCTAAAEGIRTPTF
jgi:hypothetical protein